MQLVKLKKDQPLTADNLLVPVMVNGAWMQGADGLTECVKITMEVVGFHETTRFSAAKIQFSKCILRPIFFN